MKKFKLLIYLSNKEKNHGKVEIQSSQSEDS